MRVCGGVEGDPLDAWSERRRRKNERVVRAQAIILETTPVPTASEGNESASDAA